MDMGQSRSEQVLTGPVVDTPTGQSGKVKVRMNE